jgi:eukaryotic-like serine/threonine-protein kinase
MAGNAAKHAMEGRNATEGIPIDWQAAFSRTSVTTDAIQGASACSARRRARTAWGIENSPTPAPAPRSRQMAQTKQRRKRQSKAAPPSAPAPSAPDLPRALGRWELVSLAGEGSWAQVYRARPAAAPPDMPPAYALKVLRPERRDDPAAIELFTREAVVARSVAHPHLIAVLEARVRSNCRFLVMPWLEGVTLQSRLASGRPMELPVVLWIARQVAEALEALDRAGWLHGDVKPGNVRLSPENHVTLIDLGFARRREEVDRRVMGTPQYLAPENFTSAPLFASDIRSDIYSLGVVLYELLAGRLPFTGRELAELAVEHKQAAPENLRRLAPSLPDEVVWLVHQMLAKDPLRRPQSPRELIDRLVRLEIATFSERAA